MYLLNVTKPAPEVMLYTLNFIPWWIPHAEDYIEHGPDTMAVKAANWHRFQKTANLYVSKSEIEQNVNDDLHTAYHKGEVTIP